MLAWAHLRANEVPMSRWLLVSITVLLPTLAHADLRSAECRVSAGGARVALTALKKGETYLCTATGAWLDLTNAVTAPSGLSVSVVDKGGALTSSAWVRVRVQVGTGSSTGDKRIVLKRPAPGGTDTDNFLVTVVNP